jgi:hypothetical protein
MGLHRRCGGRGVSNIRPLAKHGYNFFHRGTEYCSKDCDSSRFAAVDVVRSTASSTDYCRTGGIICRCAAVDVVRSTASSTDYCTTGSIISRCAAVDVVRSTASSTDYCRAGGIICRCSAGSVLNWTVYITQINSVCHWWSSLQFALKDDLNCWSLSAHKDHDVFCCPWHSPCPMRLASVRNLFPFVFRHKVAWINFGTKRTLWVFRLRWHVSDFSRAGNYFVRFGTVTDQCHGTLPLQAGQSLNLY